MVAGTLLSKAIAYTISFGPILFPLLAAALILVLMTGKRSDKTRLVLSVVALAACLLAALAAVGNNIVVLRIGS